MEPFFTILCCVSGVVGIAITTFLNVRLSKKEVAGGRFLRLPASLGYWIAIAFATAAAASLVTLCIILPVLLGDTRPDYFGYSFPTKLTIVFLSCFVPVFVVSAVAGFPWVLWRAWKNSKLPG